MPNIPYLGGHAWRELSREERFYCFILYEHAKMDPKRFAQWLINNAVWGEHSQRPQVTAEDEWDIGVEVCFYRDLLWHRAGDSARKRGLPFKRTFDLCLFGTRAIIIVEAKVFLPFNERKNEVFQRDRRLLKELPGMESVNPFLLALASSKYLSAYGESRVPAPFDARITWECAFERYHDPMLRQADDMYAPSAQRKLVSAG